MNNTERPKKVRKIGVQVKKRHTIKTQIIINGETHEIICIAQAMEKTHDFKLFKDKFLGIEELIQILADSGYQGIIEFPSTSKTPIDRYRNKRKRHGLRMTILCALHNMELNVA